MCAWGGVVNWTGLTLGKQRFIDSRDQFLSKPIHHVTFCHFQMSSELGGASVSHARTHARTSEARSHGQACPGETFWPASPVQAASSKAPTLRRSQEPSEGPRNPPKVPGTLRRKVSLSTTGA